MSTIAVPLLRRVTQPVRSRMEMVFAEDFHFLEEHLLFAQTCGENQDTTSSRRVSQIHVPCLNWHSTTSHA